jgi:hypothetical protein
MPSIAYYRRQADMCLKLSRLTGDPLETHLLLEMAQFYHDRAAELERDEPELPPAHMIGAKGPEGDPQRG